MFRSTTIGMLLTALVFIGAPLTAQDAPAKQYFGATGLNYGRIMVDGGGINTFGFLVSGIGSRGRWSMEMGSDLVIPEVADPAYGIQFISIGAEYLLSESESTTWNAAFGLMPTWLMAIHEDLESDFRLADLAYVKGGLVWHPPALVKVHEGYDVAAGVGLLADLGLRIPLTEEGGDSATFFRLGLAVTGWDIFGSP